MRFRFWSLLLALAPACAGPRENPDWAWDTTWPPSLEYPRMGRLEIDFAGVERPRTVVLVYHGLNRVKDSTLAVRSSVASFRVLPGEYMVVLDDGVLRAHVPPDGVARVRASDGVPDDESTLRWKGGKLSIVVNDMGGRPLPGVRVMVRGWTTFGGTSGFGDDTDERGRLDATVRVGEIHVVMGYHRRVVTVRDDCETRVEFRYGTEGAIRMEPRPRRPVIRPKGASQWLLRHGLVRGEDHATWVQVPPGEYEVGEDYGGRSLGVFLVKPGETTLVRVPDPD